MDMYATRGNNVILENARAYMPRGYWLETVAYGLKWLLPAGMMIPLALSLAKRYMAR